MAVIECLSLKDKIEWLKTRENFEVRKYLEEQTNHVKIDYYGEYPSILELMDSQTNNPLTSWCGPVSVALAYALANNGYVERGIIHTTTTPFGSVDVLHCWTCFTHNHIVYVADPCNNIIATKSDYYALFNPNLKASVSAERIRQALIQGMSYNVYLRNEPDYFYVASELNLSSPIALCGALFRSVGDNLIVKLVNFYDSRYEYPHLDAQKEFNKKASAQR